MKKRKTVYPIPYTVWLRKSDGQLGVALEGTFMGDIWMAGHVAGDEVLCGPEVFYIPDPLDHPLTHKDFIKLGYL